MAVLLLHCEWWRQGAAPLNFTPIHTSGPGLDSILEPSLVEHDGMFSSPEACKLSAGFSAPCDLYPGKEWWHGAPMARIITVT